MELLEKIRKLCEAQGLSIRQLEIKAGISKSSISKWDRHTPSSSSLARVAEVLGVSVDSLIEKETEEFFFDKETAKIAQEVFDRPDLKLLFDASRKLSPEDLAAVYAMVNALYKKENPEG